MNLKHFLKKIKSSEENLSTLFGFFVVLVIGFLIFKYFQGSKPAFLSEMKPEPTISATESPAVSLNLPKTHKVVSGETLWTIAEKYFNSGYNWVDIAKENKLANPNVLLAETELNIPDVPRRIPLSEIKSESKPITEDKYTIVKGDNLWKIALLAYGDGYRWTDIAKANELSDPSVIHPGNILVIPR